MMSRIMDSEIDIRYSFFVCKEIGELWIDILFVGMNSISTYGENYDHHRSHRSALPTRIHAAGMHQGGKSLRMMKMILALPTLIHAAGACIRVVKAFLWLTYRSTRVVRPPVLVSYYGRDGGRPP